MEESTPSSDFNREVTYAVVQEMTSNSFEDRFSLNLIDQRAFLDWIMDYYNRDGL